MLRLKDWLLLVILPFAGSLVIDQITKVWADGLIGAKLYGPVLIALSRNSGVMLGGLSQWPALYRVTSLATIGSFLVYAFFISQYFIPIKSKVFRIGLSVFAGSILGNVIDRISLGYVIDFIQLSTPLGTTGVFNVADFLQWLGVTAAFVELVRKGTVLWPEAERRGRKWIKPDFQWRYCITFLGVGLAGVLICGSLFYAFLKFTLAEARPTDMIANTITLRAFNLVFSVVTLFFSISAFLIARSLSHRIAGPIHAFENFLEALIEGKNPDFKLREHDEFAQFEAIAAKFRGHFHENLGMKVTPLREGAKAPELSASTFKKTSVNLRDFRGEKVWLCFYRYATCPICATHFAEINRRLDELKAAGVNVVVVFESAEGTFLDPETGKTYDLLASTPIPLIADPDRKLYNLYRSERSKWKSFRPSVIMSLLRSQKLGFKQSTITGDLYRIPAHILIDRDGKIFEAYYGRTLSDHIPWKHVEEFMKA